jgi:Ca2+-binding RTX toxin-like protein
VTTIEDAVGGAGNDSLKGNAADNNLAGNLGDDTIDGGTGADTMTGGGGNDTYVVDNVSDQVTETAGGGIDTVRASIDYTLGDNVENLVRLGTADGRGWGNSLDNTITGNAGNDRLRAGAGNDTVYGGDGNDNIVGGTGNDSLSGGAGNYSMDDAQGGGAGADTMAGGTGNDLYYVTAPGDAVVENIGEGIDTVRSLVGYVLPDNVEKLVLLGTGGNFGWGNALDNTVIGNAGNNALRGGQGNDTLHGGGGDDSLTGGTGRDRLLGDDGNDTLDGGAGADTLAGGGGADWFVFQAGLAANDRVTDFVPGLDTLVFTGFGTMAGGASFEQLSATDWRINPAGGGAGEVIHLANAPALSVADFRFA